MILLVFNDIYSSLCTRVDFVANRQEIIKAFLQYKAVLHVANPSRIVLIFSEGLE